jgi:hypothetical protein
MALVPYSPRASTHVSHPSAHSSRNSHHSSSTHRSPTSAPSRHTSSRSNSSSSASSTGSSYTRISTMTFGTSSRPGYAPGQAPHDYFYNEHVREEWDSAPMDSYGRRVRQTRIRGRGSEWSGKDAYTSPISRFEDGASQRGSGHRPYGEIGDDVSDDETVSPADSVSQVSSQPSRHPSRMPRASGMSLARDNYPQSAYSRRSSVMDAGLRGMYMGPGNSRRGSGTMSIANGRLVTIEVPEWS